MLAIFGIGLNSAILSVEFADIVMQERISVAVQSLTREAYHETIVDAARQRLMPIFLTTATTVGGLVPLALAGGPLWQGAILSRIIAQSAEKGSWPEVMCAAEKKVECRKLYGPTKRAEMVGPIDECPLDECALNQEAAAKLWTLSEQKTNLRWSP